jgi:hypothetical protein
VRLVHHVREPVHEPVHLGLPDDERRDQLDDLEVVARDLGEDPVLVEQRVHHGLREQALAGGLQRGPRRAQLPRRGPGELDADHQAPAAHVRHHVVLLDQPGQPLAQQVAHPAGVGHHLVGVEHVQRREAGRHRLGVGAERRVVHEHPVHR